VVSGDGRYGNRQAI